MPKEKHTSKDDAKPDVSRFDFSYNGSKRASSLFLIRNESSEMHSVLITTVAEPPAKHISKDISVYRDESGKFSLIQISSYNEPKEAGSNEIEIYNPKLASAMINSIERLSANNLKGKRAKTSDGVPLLSSKEAAELSHSVDIAITGYYLHPHFEASRTAKKDYDPNSAEKREIKPGVLRMDKLDMLHETAKLDVFGKANRETMATAKKDYDPRHAVKEMIKLKTPVVSEKPNVTAKHEASHSPADDNRAVINKRNPSLEEQLLKGK